MKKQKLFLVFLILFLNNSNMLLAQDSFYFGLTKIQKSYMAFDSSMYFIGMYGSTSSLTKVKNNLIEFSEYFGNDYEIHDLLILDNTPIILNRANENGLYKNYISKLNSNGSIDWSLFQESLQPRECSFSNNTGIIAGEKVFSYVSIENNYEIHVLSSTGNLVWSKSVGPKGDKPKIEFDKNANLIISYSKNGNLIIAKFDTQGNLLWQKEHVFASMDKMNFKNLLVLPNNAVIVYGVTVGSTESKMLYLNQNGYFQFGKVLSGNLVYQEAEINSSFLIDSNVFITFKQRPQHSAIPRPNNSGILKLDLYLNLINQIIFNDTLINNCLTGDQNSLLVSYEDQFKIISKTFNTNCDTINNPIILGNYQYLLWWNDLSLSSIYSSDLISTTLSKSTFTESLHIGCVSLDAFAFNDNKSLTLFPNPSSSHFTLSYEGEERNLVYSIHDILGKEITSGKIISENTSIDCSKWGRGVYLVKIGNENGYSVEKIIVE